MRLVNSFLWVHKQKLFNLINSNKYNFNCNLTINYIDLWKVKKKFNHDAFTIYENEYIN